MISYLLTQVDFDEAREGPVCWNRSKMNIDAHGLKIQGRGHVMFIVKTPGGGHGFQEKLPGGGGSPYFGFYTFIAFLLTSVLKFA